MQHKFKMNLQFFAESGGEPGQQSQPEGGQTGGSPQTPPQEPQIDYNKIQQMLDGTLAAKENTALKAYFKQQKAANTPDIEAIQNQVQTAQKMAQQAMIEVMEELGDAEDDVTPGTLSKLCKLIFTNQTQKDLEERHLKFEDYTTYI